MDHFSSLFIPPASSRQLLAAASGGGKDKEEQMIAMYGGSDSVPYLFKMDTNSREAERVIAWMNDITKDSRYTQWPLSVREFLAQSWGQQLKYVRQNVYTGVLILDPTTKEGLSLVSDRQCMQICM